MKSKISVVIAWCDRVALRTSLSQNWPYFRRAGAEVLLVNCGGNRSLARRLVSVSAGNGPIRVIHLAAGSFNKSLALNVGSSLATSSHLCFLDADVVISPTLLDQLRARATGDTFSTVRDVVESQLVGQTSETALSETSQHLAFTLRDGRRARILISRTGYRQPRRTGPGLVCLSRRHFVSVGGMNAELKGWGWEDLDLIIRLSLKLGLKRREHGSVIHLTHTDRVRLKEQDRRNRMQAMARYHAGDLDGTYLRDVERYSSRVVEDLVRV